ncbi:MAG: ATP-dependent DNA helicase, partial [Desulfobacteraceae bacterium]|nr:ATP-dependent DNA helicase [Desulfobacteraceae bacterium]
GKGRLHKKVAAYASSSRPVLLAPPYKLPPFGDILRVLNKYHLLPAIFFLKSRADCDNALDLCADDLTYDPDRTAARSQRIEELVAKSPHIAGHRQLWQLEHLAVGAHHSGQLPAWKLILETLMTEGILDAVFATSTVAAGVNFPARTIVFFNSDRFNGREFLPLDATEFHQMTGRAGRRGMDHIGFAMAVPGKFMDIRRIAKLVTSRSADVSSQIKINFSMVLNLLLSHTPDQIKDLLSKSFATFMIVKERRKKGDRKPFTDEHKKLWGDFLHHLDFLKETGYVTQDGVLTADGIWASQLRVDQPLIIAEGFRRGIFPESDPALLAAVTTLFVNERESDDHIEKVFKPKTLLAAVDRVQKGLQPFAALMADRGFEVRPLFLRPAAAIYAWAAGQPWEKVLAIAEMEEGDLAMLILRTADNLRHIRSLKRVFPEAALTSATSIDLIMRSPVAMEYE